VRFHVWRAITAAVLLHISGVRLAGAQGAGERLNLSLEEALQRADAGLAMRLATAEIARAMGARLAVQPLVPANPILSFEIGPRRLDTVTETSFMARVEQPLDLFGQRGMRLASADKAIVLSQSQRTAIRAAVRAQTRLTYVAILASRRREGVARLRLETGQRTLRAARERVRVGAASQVESYLAELELGRAEQGLIRAERETMELVAELRELIDLPPWQSVALTTSLGLPAVRDRSVDALVRRARERRADFLALQNERHLAEAEIERLRRERYPTIGLAFTMQRDLPTDTWYGVGLSFAPPLAHRNQGAIAQASAGRQRAEALVDVASRGIERQLRRTMESAASRRRELALSEGGLVRSAERARDLIQEGWRAGKFDLFRVLQAERELLESRLAQIDAWAAVWAAEIQIDLAVGEERTR
jgi:outer membrane protein, heavy metal efflux system